MKIKYTVTTKSNCLIGNQTSAFSIGGVDQCTTLDENGKPIIHGSAMKGALRNIFRKECKKNDIIEKFIVCLLLIFLPIFVANIIPLPKK